MKLSNIDINKISKYKPEFLRLYIYESITDEEFNFISQGLNRIVNRVSISTDNDKLRKAIKLQFPIVISESTNVGIYRRSKFLVEMDITTKCNLACNNCSRFSQFRTLWNELNPNNIDKFIEENRHLGNELTVAILGGEPTLHKDLNSIILKLSKYFNVMLSTNGLLPYQPPIDIVIENSAKSKGVMPLFSSTMLAPIDDDTYKNDDYSLGCHQAYICGCGYTNDGYYPCSIASAIDRATRLEGGPRENDKALGCKSIEEAIVNKEAIFNELCRYCGTYKMKNFSHFDIKHQLTDEQPLSKSWEFIKDIK